MTGVDLILAALTAGTAAGAGGAAQTAVQDAYVALRDALRRRLTGGQSSTESLEAIETEPDTWQARLGPELERSGAAVDSQILDLARHLLRLTAMPQTSDAHDGGATFNVGHSSGAVGIFNSPVTLNPPAEAQPSQHEW
ncbi:hypothetical protein [Streptomyces collinus]|uniref:hypothetical protein n=1 Tax=Streptomyces collinus TaxID=42684 RepID=UPI003635E55F